MAMAMANLRRILAAAALVAGVALALPAHAAEPATRAVGGIEVPEDEVALVTAVDASDGASRWQLAEMGAGPGADLPVELVRASVDEIDPFQRARDYGRLLILLSVPAAFVGLHLHLSRRAHVVPPVR
jgi:hypothetical protein